MTLPGVDVAVAEALLAALGDVTRFASGAKAAAYLGLVPSTKQSPDRCYHAPTIHNDSIQLAWMVSKTTSYDGRIR